MKVKIWVFVFVLAHISYGATQFFAGDVVSREISSAASITVPAAYKREVKPENKVVIETSIFGYNGKKYLEIYVFDHNTKQLTVMDGSGKVVSKAPFRCKGEFPKLKSCTYKFSATFEVKGQDIYHPKTLQYRSIAKDKKTGKTFRTEGEIPAVTESEFADKLEKIEKLPASE
jgi:hypothetical protein